MVIISHPWNLIFQNSVLENMFLWVFIDTKTYILHSLLNSHHWGMVNLPLKRGLVKC